MRRATGNIILNQTIIRKENVNDNRHQHNSNMVVSGGYLTIKPK